MGDIASDDDGAKHMKTHEGVNHSGGGNGAETDSNLKEADIGAVCEIKTLYEGPPECNCCINWVDEAPTNIRDNIEEQVESKKRALLVRMKRNHGDGKPWVLHSVVVQSTRLKQFLGKVFEGYAGITTTLKKLVFQAPFHAFFYEWERLNELISTEEYKDDGHAWLLRDFLEAELKDILATYQDLMANKVMTFEYLWTMFKVGEECHFVKEGYDCMLQITKARYTGLPGESCYVVTGNKIDFDGERFGFAKASVAIWQFAGTRALVDLEALPRRFHPESDTLKNKLRVRGQRFRQLLQAPYHHGEYSGLATDTTGNPFKVHGRVLVDTASYKYFNLSARIDLVDLKGSLPGAKLDVQDPAHAGQEKLGQSEEDYDAHRRRARTRRSCGGMSGSYAPQEYPPDENPAGLKKKKQTPQLDDTFLHLCSPVVRGYCLQSKKWANLYLDLIREIRWNTNAFESLVLDDDLKRLILALVKSQAANKDKFDDIIEGKGRGIIMLLEGSPGVGKTLTAEATAEELSRPLYVVSGGELGTHAHGVEAALEMILHVAAKWDAVLLLDECDVFLEKRDLHDLARNGTVAVFLRLLEYFSGVLFMTTNRVEIIDPAFDSRIHLSIRYPKLSQEARQRVWKTFLAANCPDSRLGENEVKEMAKLDLNGREIKNLIKTAHLWATHEEEPLDINHCRSILKVTKRGGSEN